MSNKYEFFSKDYIKFYMLNETVNSKAVSFKLFLEANGTDDDFLNVRSTERSVYRFNNFNVSEDATKNCITFRPNVVGCYAYFSISTAVPLKVEIIRNGTDFVAETIELNAGTTKLDFKPQGTKKYDLNITSDSSAVPAANPAGASGVSGGSSSGSNPAPVQNQPDPFGTVIPAFGAPQPATPANNPAPVTVNPAGTPAPDPFSGPSGFTTPAPQPAPADNSYTTYSPRTEPSGTPFGMPGGSSEQMRERERARDQVEGSNVRLERDIAELEGKISELQRQNQALIDKKNNLTSHLEKLQQEFDKDYSSFSADVEEINSRFMIDAEILKLYENTEVTPIEQLIQNAQNDIKQIEDQIRTFVEAQERKTAELEKELKIGRKE